MGRIFKKIAKVVVGMVLILLGFLLLLSILVYMPPVQRFIKNQASSIVANSMGMDLDIGRFRLRFPLTVALYNTSLSQPGGDTLVRFGKLSVGVAIGPLLRGEIRAGEIVLRDAAANYSDTVSNMAIKGNVGELLLRATGVRLKEQTVNVGSIGIRNTSVDFSLGQSAVQDTAAQADLLWKIGLGELELDNIRFNMHTSPEVAELAVNLPRGFLSDLSVDLGARDVAARLLRLESGDYSYLTDTVQVAATVADPVSIVDSLSKDAAPWTVNVTKIELDDNSLAYGSLYGEPGQGVATSHIRLDGIDIIVDSLYNRSTDISANISRLALRERSGLEITEGEVRFSMDSSGIALHNFSLHTPASSLRADANAGAGVMNMEPSTPVALNISAVIAPDDIFRFVPLDEGTKSILNNKFLTLDSDISGTLGDMDITSLLVNMPRHINFAASGNLVSVTDPDRMSGDFRFNADFADVNFIREFLSDSLQNSIAFPAHMALNGTAAIAPDLYSADMTLTTDTLGKLNITGSLNPKLQDYQAEVTSEDFPVYQFLPRQSFGYLSFGLKAEGRGFDLTADTTRTWVDLYVEGLDYNNYYYDGIWLEAYLYDHVIEGNLFGRNDALDLDIDIGGEIRDNYYAGMLSGRIALVDLQAMNLSPTPLAGSLIVEASASAIPDSLLYKAEMKLDTVRIAHGAKLEKIDHTTVNALAGRSNMDVRVRSGDFSLDFTSPVPMNTLVNSFSSAADTIMAQVSACDINMANIQPLIPSLHLEMFAGRDNVLNSLMRGQGYGFDSITVKAATQDGSPLNAGILVEGFEMSNLTVDTLNLGFMVKDEALDLYFRIANRPGNVDQMALIGIGGEVVRNTARFYFYQRDRNGDTGFNFGLNGELRDSSIYVTMFPDDPVFGYKNWKVNQGNYVEYHFNNELYANMRLDGDAQHFYIQQAASPAMPPGAVNLNMEGIVLGEVFRLLPSAPPVDGVVSSDIDFSTAGSAIVVNGRAGVDALAYENRRVGDVGADISFEVGADSLFRVDGTVTLDDSAVFTAEGTYAPSRNGALDFNITVPSLPLSAAAAFIPEETVTLDGTLQGDLTLSGNMEKMDVNGGLGFTDGRVTVDMTGSTFRLSPNRINVTGNVLDFNDFSLIAPNNQPLTLDGTVNITDFSRMYADLHLFASNFEAINSSRSGGSPVYGRAVFDVDITARGPLDGISAKGDVRLLSSSDVTYTLQDSPVDIENKKQDIVTFISFADTTAVSSLADAQGELRVWSMDMLVNVDIDEGVKVAVNLSANGNNRIELTGGGNLTYAMNNQGDTRLSGRYALSGGTVVYNPPIISQKFFTVNDGSYVEWTGEMLDPSFNITATETVRTTVTMEDNTTSTVNFNIMIMVRNSLEDMVLAFDLAAPGNLTIQNQLTSMAPEQRSQQALALLVYNTYTGPGTSATVDSNNPVNSFIEKELNQWARNNLRNIDVSFGIDSYDDGTGVQHTDYSYQVSKSLFDDRVKVTVGGSLSTDADASQNVKENFVDDISLEYRLTKRDNMFLKVYRYNTQESILEGEVTETGVGFLVRRKMDNMGDLFRITRSPERRRIRKAMAEAEEQAQQKEDGQREEERRAMEEGETYAGEESESTTNTPENE